MAPTLIRGEPVCLTIGNHLDINHLHLGADWLRLCAGGYIGPVTVTKSPNGYASGQTSTATRRFRPTESQPIDYHIAALNIGIRL